jgi:hypothetical protein
MVYRQERLIIKVFSDCKNGHAYHLGRRMVVSRKVSRFDAYYPLSGEIPMLIVSWLTDACTPENGVYSCCQIQIQAGVVPNVR